MTRTEKWKYKRLKLECDRDILANALLDTSEKLMSVHSEISQKAFNTLMGDPLERLDEMMTSLKERKKFL
jgi:hypothetical protein